MRLERFNGQQKFGFGVTLRALSIEAGLIIPTLNPATDTQHARMRRYAKQNMARKLKQIELACKKELR